MFNNRKYSAEAALISLFISTCGSDVAANAANAANAALV